MILISRIQVCTQTRTISNSNCTQTRTIIIYTAQQFELALYLTPNKVEESLEMIRVDISGPTHEQVGDFRLSKTCQVSEFFRINWDLTPADDLNIASGED